jgi:hypothetical protein
LLKGVFMAPGIGSGHHDMETHVETPGHPLLVHIHHVFFNLGFLLFAAAGAGLLVRALTAPPSGAPPSP